MRHIVVFAADKDNEVQVVIELRVPQDFSWDMCRHMGLTKCIPQVCEFANLHRSTGSVEQWTFVVREKQQLPWAKYISP